MRAWTSAPAGCSWANLSPTTDWTGPPPAGDADCYSLGLYCADADDVVARAEAAGAVIREPLSTFVTGDWYASIHDPSGVR